MPTVDRTDQISSAVAGNWERYTLIEKIQFVGTALTAAFTAFIPLMIVEKITGKKFPNAGRLRCVVNGQIYQQRYGSSNSTILVNKKKDGLVIHTAPEITADFLADVAQLGVPVKYVMISNEVHETHASAAKDAYPQAKVVCPKVSRELVSQCVPVDATQEDILEELETDFGFVKVFEADDNVTATADRSFLVQLYGDDENIKKGNNCLFVAQCGYGNNTDFNLMAALGGFQGWFNRGRYFRMFYWSFTNCANHAMINPYWKQMVNNSDNLQVAIFQHGNPIVGDDTKEQLLKFYVY
mmetsp:Transcript_33696/g.49134  ORF Transcript_33696/g.49134 Transcript_33696/m.49134 type:complete len:297 (+) Transcript_33696:144-1034(+)